MWKIDRRNGTYCVVDSETGSVEDCHDTRAKAQEQIDALNLADIPDDGVTDASAAVEARMTALLPLPTWEALIIPEGVRSADGRIVDVGALSHRQLPLPLMLLTRTSNGHDGAEICGSILTLGMRDDDWWGTGTYLDDENGRRAANLVGKQVLRWMSADLDAEGKDFVVEEDAEGNETLRIVRGVIAAATLVPIPAFESAVAHNVSDALVASAIDWSQAVDVPEHPPASWFTEPEMDYAMPVHVSPDGRVYGLACEWDRMHIAFSGEIVYPPKDYSNFRWFNRRPSMTCDDGTTVQTGPLTLGGGHADTGPGRDSRYAIRYYDDVTNGVADVVCGRNRFGIWIAGRIRPGTTRQQVAALRGSDVSGDWRWIEGRLEFVGIHAVNTGGFLIPGIADGAHVRNGEVLSLVASAGRVEQEVTPVHGIKVSGCEFVVPPNFDVSLTGITVNQLVEGVDSKVLADIAKTHLARQTERLAQVKVETLRARALRVLRQVL